MLKKKKTTAKCPALKGILISHRIFIPLLDILSANVRPF